MRKLTNEELNRISKEEFEVREKNKFILVLDNVRSLNNVGSAFRTGDAFLVEKIYLCGITGTPPHREIQKTALGATDSVKWEYVEDTLQLIQRIKSEGYVAVSLEQADQSIPLNQFVIDPKKKYAFIFGNEVFGVHEDVVKNSDFCVEIPQFGTKHSLNISVTVGIVAWDFFLKSMPLPV